MSLKYSRVYLLIFIIVALAFASRLVLLDLRPLHHDEGVNYFFAKGVIDGVGWKYDPFNYHGPFYFFAIMISFFILGVNEFSLRLPAALFGIILVVLPLFLKFKDERFDKFGKYLFSAFLLVSPSIFYYSRYSIHEISYVLFCFLSVYLLSQVLEKKDLNYLPYFALCLAIVFSIKETVIIFLAILLVMVYFGRERVKEINFKDNYGLMWFSVFVFIFFHATMFTNFFSYTQGFFDSFKSYMPWIKRGVGEIGHDKPFYYYLFVLAKYEFALVVLGLVGAWYSWKKDIFCKNMAIWFVLTFLIYSGISYKTPWLIVNFSASLCFLSAIALIEIYHKNKNIGIILGILAFASLGYFAIQVNFITPWQPSNTYAYVHTSAEVYGLVDRVDELPGEILIVSNESNYWPMPFYLDKRKVSYVTADSYNADDYKDSLEKYGLVLVDGKIFDEDSASGYSYEKYLLRDGVEMWIVTQKASCGA